MAYSIGEVSKRLGITVDTIRYYDKENLIPFVKRDDAGRRKFTDNDMHLMEMIMCLKNAGVPVAEIATFVALRKNGDKSLDERYQLLQDHEKNLKSKISDLQDTLAYLQFKKWYYQTAVNAGTEKIHYEHESNEVHPHILDEYIKVLKKRGDTDSIDRLNNQRRK
ncbi:MerR family transcriptional regulator [Companilactobacillus mishanensis]|uniref:MerR family transcriptional regulator n=1 Tax=Companilactobacillus mishanensis TaxID=2486008 RepID=A0A5P0ZG91_9LACO|nr:MerR family transcriptional regulator [Companilactobacillus mishanensis]MQS52066.1 MerR family transcriptional regulator [Companilactobacillus mishanensis]